MAENLTIEHISVSRKQTWDQCPQAYKYHYHLKVLPEGPEPPYFTYGSYIHKVAEIYVKNKGEVPINVIGTKVLMGEIPLEDPEPGKDQPPPTKVDIPQEYKNKIPKHLAALKGLTDRIGYDGEVEFEFRLDLDPPHGRHVKGFIDRLFVKNDKYFIIDYKTTKKGPYRKTKHNINQDLQLRCYAWVVHTMFNVRPEDIRAALFYLEGAELVDARFTDESLYSVANDLRNCYVEIENTDVEDVWGTPGNHCNRCNFAGICPFFV